MAQASLAVPLPVAGTARAPQSRRFYVQMAYTCLAIAFLGFVPTYWAPVARGGLAAPPILHVHGLLFTAWMVLFVLQARSGAAGSTDRHRAGGLAGIAMATAMVFVGLTLTIVGIRYGEQAGRGDATRAFAIVPVTVVLTFAAFFAAAIASARRPETHMRLMLAATIALLTPALGRVFLLLFAPPGSTVGLGHTPPVPVTLGPSFVTDLVLGVAMVRDRRADGRVHRAYAVALAVLLVTQIGRVPLAGTTAWRAVTEGMTAICR